MLSRYCVMEMGRYGRATFFRGRVGTTETDAHSISNPQRRDMQRPKRAVARKERHIYTRIPAILAHISMYSFQGQARLAADAGTSRSTINRLVHDQCVPSFALVYAIQKALEIRLGRKLPIEEWLSLDDEWPTTSICELVGCPACLPDAAYNADGSLKPSFEHIAPGRWTIDDLRKEGK